MLIFFAKNIKYNCLNNQFFCKKCPFRSDTIYELENRSKVKQQILGKSFLSDRELDKYARYENHLDKKFEKTLTMLIKLQDLRRINEL